MKMVVLSNAQPGRDDEFNKWYDEQHLPDLLAIPGVASGTRFTLRNPEGVPAPDFRYLAIYEIDGDPGAVLQEIGVRNQDGRMSMSDALDSEHFNIGFWEAQ
jgi:hypothetical protein